MNALKNRIIAHLRVPAGNLKPHPLNFRLHPEVQTLLAIIMLALAPFPTARAVLAQAMANLHEPKVIDHEPAGNGSG